MSAGERGTAGFGGHARVPRRSSACRTLPGRRVHHVLIDTEKESIPDWRFGDIRSGLLGKWSGARATHRAGHAVERDSFDVDRQGRHGTEVSAA